MKAFLAFVAIGSVFATVEEFLTIVVLRHDIPSYVFTLIILFPVYLSLVYATSRLLDRGFGRGSSRLLAHFLVYGWVGLMMEWFLMGLAPWSNPEAPPLLMLGFQLGMFAFWATVATAPRVFLDPDPSCRRARGRMLKFGVPFFVIVYAIALSIPASLRFGAIILLILIGYSTLAGLILRCVVERSRGERDSASENPVKNCSPLAR